MSSIEREEGLGTRLIEESEREGLGTRVVSLGPGETAEWRNGRIDACLQPENRKLNRKLNCNGTGTKLQWPN